MRILIVDDEQTLLHQLKDAFEDQRYTVEIALDGEEALDKLFEGQIDLIILDIMLPKHDGLSALEIESVAAKNPLDVNEILTSLIIDYQPMAELRNIRLSINLPQRPIIEGDKEKLHRAFSNILDNAVKYSPDGGQIEIAGFESSSDLAITISNIGPGVPETEIPKVFDQFYRVEQSRSSKHGGSGLGLSIVKRIVELHGGNLKFESRQNSWTRVTVSLPRHRKKLPI